MLDLAALNADLEAIGFADWREPLQALLPGKLGRGAHGDLPRWQQALAGLPALPAATVDVRSAVVAATAPRVDPQALARLRQSLLLLTPWRKGPFSLYGVRIDAEWRSDLKWARLQDAISPLPGRTVLDVGSGNGYYALRMKGAGARCVLGIDPTLLCLAQFTAIQTYLRQPLVHVLPLRLQEMPAAGGRFDTTFSLGVLYHQRQPLQHLRQLRETLRHGGELVLETLVLPGDDAFETVPAGRYARMRNVWCLPSTARLQQWLEQAGFRHCRVVDVAVTRTAEQRSTDWMPFESLAQALHADDPQLTIEGLPRPRRALLICSRP